ncbi:glycosyltransferase [Polluticoccus soli]|uniref:glycosyltransferase n=1 Tax=Polluticoccus soli TaxID=3034150 RepID=UPI0023E09ABD|nr:glycosyltransferase [Flavipsychrobacter sp. JY13-12]
MKILFLANRIPYPPYRGDKLKIFNLAKRLSKKHELHLLTFAQTKQEFEYKQELEKIFKKVDLIYLPKWKSALNCLSAAWDNKPLQVLYFQSGEMQAKLNDVLSEYKFDAIHVQHLRMSPYLKDRKDLPRILDLPDAFSLYWERRKKIQRNFPRRVFENMEQSRVLKYEKVTNDYNLSLVCSNEDLEYLKEVHGLTNIKLLPNGVDLDSFKAGGHDYEHNHTILFTGNMDYAPNIDAVGYFTEEILPLVRVRFPETKFIIAGQRPVPKVQALANEHVLVTGFVKDFAKVYNDASVVVAPLRFGAGTQNKVLEAMAMGVPVVCSHIGFKGLGIQSGEGAIMQTDPTRFAETIIELLSSASMRKDVGTKGVEVIRNRFGWDVIAQQLECYLQEVSRN